MKLRDTSQPNIVAAKIINVTPKNVTVITEEGHLLKIDLHHDELNKYYQSA